MKTPSLLALFAVALAAPAFAEAPHRCDVDWLRQAQKVLALSGTPGDAKKYLKTEPVEGGQRLVFDVAGQSKVCDGAVWHYLAVPKKGGVELDWADEGLRKDWDAGLAEQIRILLSVDELYAKVDALAWEAITHGAAAADAGVKAGLVARKDGDGLGRLVKDGYAGAGYAAEKSFTVIPADPKAPAAKTEVLKAALGQLLADAPAAKGAPPAVKPGSEVLAFRTAVFRIADLLAVSAARRDISQKNGVDAKVTVDFFRRSSGALYVAYAEGVKDGKSVFPEEVAGNDESFKNAVKFVTDPAIAGADDETARESAALSRLDYGARNLIASRANAVDAAVDAAKKRLAGRSVADALAAADHDAKEAALDPDAPKPGTIAADVLNHLKNVKDYKDLNALYDKKNDAGGAWLKTDEGQAVAAQLKSLRDDAKGAVIVKDANGRSLQYSVGGQKVSDTGISVADLEKDQAYRQTIAEAIAQNIVSNPLSAKAQAALAAFRGEGAPGTPVGPPLTQDQQNAAAKLPPAVKEPPKPLSPYDQLLAATPAAGFFNFLDPKGAVERYYSKINEDAAGLAQTQSDQRTKIEEQANDAADRVQERADDERKRIEKMAPDPDDTVKVAAAKKAAALAAHDRQTGADVAAARKKVVADALAAKRYVPAAEAEAALKAKREALWATVDAAYSDGITRAVDKLSLDYKQAGGSRRKYAEKKSGYEGQYYKTERVDRYFTERWKGDRQEPATATCKTALGFSKSLDTGSFQDPSADNVDEKCGVRDGLVALLRSYRGTNDKIPDPAK